MKYKVHEEITCESIGDMYFLIAYGRARETLNFLIAVNETGAFYWKLLEEHRDTGEMLSIAGREYEMPGELLREGLESFLKDLCDRGYIEPA